AGARARRRDAGGPQLRPPRRPPDERGPDWRPAVAIRSGMVASLERAARTFLFPSREIGSRLARMYFDQRLWALTEGVRGRIAGTVIVGLAAVVAGIARLRPLGWVFRPGRAGDSLAELAPAIALTALALVVRSALDYTR